MAPVMARGLPAAWRCQKPRNYEGERVVITLFCDNPGETPHHASRPACPITRGLTAVAGVACQCERGGGAGRHAGAECECGGCLSLLRRPADLSVPGPASADCKGLTQNRIPVMSRRQPEINSPVRPSDRSASSAAAGGAGRRRAALGRGEDGGVDRKGEGRPPAQERAVSSRRSSPGS